MYALSPGMMAGCGGGWDGTAQDAEEQKADAFAANLLIPSSVQGELPGLKSKAAVIAFAERIGIHPGIVVGRLQYDGHVDMSWMNDLKDTFAWKENGHG